MTSAAWVACLADFREHLRQQRAALAEGRADEIEPFQPLPDLQALPADLRHQAERLLVEALALTSAIEDASRRVAAELRLVSALSSGPSASSPSYVDTRG